MMQYKENTLASHKPRKNYSQTVDTLKGMAMIMVIMVHFDSEPYLGYGIVMTLFYAVPLYFLISGYLLSQSAGQGFPTYLWKRVKGLLIPYVLFFALNLFWTVTGSSLLRGGELFGYAVDWSSVLKAFVFAGKFLFDIALVPAPLWFLHALFLLSILFYFIAKIKSKLIVTLLAVALAIAAMPLQNAMGSSPYWIITMLPAGLFFMTAGHLVRLIQKSVQKIADEVDQKSGAKPARVLLNSFVGLGLLVVSILLMRVGRGDLWSITSDWYFPAALLFIGGCFLLARESNNRALLYTGRNSLYYLGLHPIVLQLPFMTTLFQKLIDTSLDNFAAYFCFLIIAYLMTTVLVYITSTVVGWIKRLFSSKHNVDSAVSLR